MRCKPRFSSSSLFSLSSNEKPIKQNVSFQVLEWRPTAGRRTSNALIPIVGDEAVNAEDHTTICGEEELAYRRSKAKYAHRERERKREIGTKRRYIPIATVTNDNQPLQKVTKSLYIVTDLGQLPFMLFT